MEAITLPVAELKPALNGLSKVISKRSTLAVLGMVKVERTSDGWIALTGTNLDTFVTVRMEQPTSGSPCTVLVPLDDLQTVVKPLDKNDSIQVLPLNAEQVTIKTPVGTGWADTKCDTAPLADYPAIPKFAGEPIAVPDAVRQSIHEAFECASTDETRYILNGAYVDVSKEDCHCVVGTDGRHLFSSNSFSLPLEKSVIIPTHRFLGWKEFNSDGEWRLKAGASLENEDVRHIQISSRRWRFITRHMEGNYPAWRQVVVKPQDAKTHVAIEDPEAVLQVINRMPDHDERDHTIGIQIEGDALLLMGKANAQDSDWFSVPIPNAKASGSSVRVNVNRQFLIKALGFGLTNLDLIDPLSPMRLWKEGKQMIVMPLRVEGARPSPAANTSAATASAVPAPSAPASTPTPTEQSGGKGEAQTAASEPSESKTTSDNTMIERSTSANTAPATNTASKNMDSLSNVEKLIDDALIGVEELKEDLEKKVHSLATLRGKLKVLQKEHKTAAKELETVRKSIKGLQSVKL